MTAKHTPGPWLLQDRTVYSMEHYGWRKGKELFTNRFYAAVLRGPTISDEELEANACLIAAAPDLLDALETLAAEEFRDDDDPILGQARAKARAALAKAKGETK